MSRTVLDLWKKEVEDIQKEIEYDELVMTKEIICILRSR